VACLARLKRRQRTGANHASSRRCARPRISIVARATARVPGSSSVCGACAAAAWIALLPILRGLWRCRRLAYWQSSVARTAARRDPPRARRSAAGERGQDHAQLDENRLRGGGRAPRARISRRESNQHAPGLGGLTGWSERVPAANDAIDIGPWGTKRLLGCLRSNKQGTDPKTAWRRVRRQARDMKWWRPSAVGGKGGTRSRASSIGS
jgi:hypothetical protein